MRKSFAAALTAAVLALAGCATSIPITYNMPSEIDMGQRRNVAVASTVAFQGMARPPRYVTAVDSAAYWATSVVSSYDSYLPGQVADYATESLVASLRETGFFNITSPSVADGLIERSRAGFDIREEVESYGIDAFIVPKVVSMDTDEYIASEPYYYFDYNRLDEAGNPIRLRDFRYHLVQSCSLVWSYTVIDAETMTVYATKTFSDKVENTTEVTRWGFLAPDAIGYYERMLDNFTWLTARQLAPSRVTVEIELMGNKPKAESVEGAYDDAGDGYLARASETFRLEWEASGHIPSGYNYALLTAATGGIGEAIAFLEEMPSDSEGMVQSLLSDLRTIRSRNEQAGAQISGSSPGGNYTDSDKNVFSLVIGS